MDRPMLNYWIDVGLAITFLICGITGVLKMPGLITNLGLSYADLPFRLITNMHDWSGIILIVLVGIHLALHLSWIKAMTKRVFRHH